MKAIIKGCFGFLIIMLFAFSRAEGSPAPFCNYPNIADAYQSADIAVIGRVMGKTTNGFDLQFQVLKVIKGTVGSEITLRGQRRINTEVNGFVFLPENSEIFLILRRDGSLENLYDAAQGYNNPCPTFYSVVDGKVVLREPVLGSDAMTETQVAAEQIKDYFEG